MCCNREILVTNHLDKETSPYLLQHVNNPVDWHPWGERALGLAKKENKPISVEHRLRSLSLVPRDGP
jgi:uncharacterized protein YyaL (SSP411 family)